MVAFYLPGGIPIYILSLLLAIGAFIGMAFVAARSPEGAALRRVEAGTWTLAGGLVGGRAAYVALAWPYYRSHLNEALQVNLGGMVWPGVLAGGLLVLAVYAALSRQSLGVLADALIPLLAALSIAGWLGCLVEGCGYGAPNALLGVASPDEWGAVTRRWPVQIISALLCLVFFWIVDRLPENINDLYGLRACLMMLALAVVQLGATLFNAQPLSWRGLPIDAWAALVFAGVALMGLGIVYRAGHAKQ